MRRLLYVIGFFVLIILFIPYLSVSLLSPKEENMHTANAEPIDKITAYNTETDSVSEMDFSTYLNGVVAAEMPASFEKEALKAQAVAARSYILRRKDIYERDGAAPEHKGAMTCDNPAHCKAYSSEEKLRAQWADRYDEYMGKVEESVKETAGVIMTYDGEVVNAVFHSTSSGSTENAKDVWGGDVAYLVSVKSEGDELSPRFDGEVGMSIDEFKNKILSVHDGAKWENGEPIVEGIERSDAGGIMTLVCGGVKMKASELRALFSLQSTNIDFFYEGDDIIMRTKGNGHGVGMSQYGANYLASTGMGYEEILKKYYTGVEIVRYDAN